METRFDNNNPEWYEGNDTEIDYNELNKTINIARYASTNNNNIDYSDINPAATFQKLKLKYDNQDDVKLNKTMTTAVSEDDNPIQKFNRIKNEIDLIEKDLEFYNKNKELFTSKYPLEKSFLELKNFKAVTDYISQSDNFKILKEIKEKNPKIDKENYKLLNVRVYEKLNEHLINKMKIINNLKAQNIDNFNNVEYELYITPDTQKVKLFTKIMDLKKSIQNIEAKIGSWDMKSKKQSVGEVVNNIKNNMRLFDKDYQKEIQSKMEALNEKLKNLNEGKEEFYTTINKPKIDELYKCFSASNKVEDLIFKTIAKLDSLQNNHEESAFIFLKIKEMLDQQEKISANMDENSEILTNLKSNITENVTTMKKNIENIRERLKNLKK